ncbi:MAG: hypothetical protein H8E32_05355 [Nitrospinae bacterium]|nr:hypothetical protein [Nitrospinota bacterium]
MERFKRYAKGIAVGVTGVFAGATPAFAIPLFTIDTTQAVEDVTAAGIAILAVSVTIFGVKKIRQIVKA